MILRRVRRNRLLVHEPYWPLVPAGSTARRAMQAPREALKAVRVPVMMDTTNLKLSQYIRYGSRSKRKKGIGLE